DRSKSAGQEACGTMRTLISGVVVVFALAAQSDVQTLSRNVQALRWTVQLSASAGSQADKLLAEAADLIRINQTGEARRRLGNAQALVNGKSWDAREEFLGSLTLRPQRVVAEPSSPMTIELAQIYAAA